MALQYGCAVSTGPTNSAPKSVQTKNDMKRPVVSLNSTGPSRLPFVAWPNSSPPTKAATNPLPPIATDPV